MTRDPSDGSVRDVLRRWESEAGMAECGPVIEAGTSGLPINKQRADQLARLQRSRDWLSKYRTNPEAVACLKGDTDHINTEAPDLRSSHPGNGE